MSELARTIFGARSELSRTALLAGASVPEVGPGRQVEEGSGEVPRGKGQTTRQPQIATAPEKDSCASRRPRQIRLARSSGWICAGLIVAATLWAQTGPPSEQLRRARELVIAGKPEEAIPIYQELVRAAPNSPELLMDLCITEFKAKRS